MGKYTVISGQSLYDIALHIYGSIEGITDLLVSNPSLSLDDTLEDGQELFYSDDFEIDTDVIAWFKSQGITPASGECKVYPKTFTLPLLAEVRIEAAQALVGMSLCGSGEIEIDWGDNSPVEHLTLNRTLQSHVNHAFDNAVADYRRVRIFGIPTLSAVDLTSLHPFELFLFQKMDTESFTLQDTRVDIAFLALCRITHAVNLRGTLTEDLTPLLANLSLAELNLDTDTLRQQTIDSYLIALVERNFNRHNCNIILATNPSGEYQEPQRDENGRYRITTGMGAVWVLTHEPSWNEAGPWRITIRDKEYTYRPSNNQ